MTPTRTWADRQDFDDEARPRADLVECPCCGTPTAADMIVRLPAPPSQAAREALDERIADFDRIPWTRWPEWACTAQLATVHREGLAPEFDELTGNK